MTREEAKHIDAFKYWCKTNEGNGVITIPEFICKNIVKILDDNKQRPHGEWVKSPVGSYCSNCKSTVPFNPLGKEYFSPFCMECGADMREEGDSDA